MNDSKIIDRLSVLICFPTKFLFVPVPLYYTINKAKSPWKKKVELLLYPHALIVINSNGFRDYFYDIIRWQDLKGVRVESQGSLNLFVALAGRLCLLSYLMIFLGFKLFFVPEIAPTALLPIIAGFFSGLVVATSLYLEMPKYCLQLKTDSELYVLTISNSSDFATMKSFAEKIVEMVELGL